MNVTLNPTSVPELIEAVRSKPHVLAVGARTKPRLSQVPNNFTLLSTQDLKGIVEYEPDEFTFTALAGTLVRDIAAKLAERGQYLPFDPMLVAAGATLGGTVASGLSGPGRFRFGGLRDFILGVRFVDGAGRLLRMGGKVVKNAAGFDLPKFFVGSLGRFGVLAEITFKVFPRPASALTLKLAAKTAEAAAQILTQAANSRWQPDALDILPGGEAVCLRLAGPATALKEMSREILARWPGDVLSSHEAETIWTELREFRWAHVEGVLWKVSITPDKVRQWNDAGRSLNGVRTHVSAGGNVAFISVPNPAQAGDLGGQLSKLGLAGMTLRGSAPLWCGLKLRPAIADAVKRALDSDGRFPSLDD